MRARRLTPLALSAALAACAPAGLETPPVELGEAYAFLVLETPTTLRTLRLDAETPAAAVNAEGETVHWITVPRAAAALAHALVDLERDRDVELGPLEPAELAACESMGVLQRAPRTGPRLGFPPRALGATLHELREGAWQAREWPGDGALPSLALWLPIEEGCQVRDWRAESFFESSPIIRPDQRVRGVELPRTQEQAFHVGALFPLPDGRYLMAAGSLAAVAAPGGPLDEAGSLVVYELPPPPAAWAPRADAVLGWRNSAFFATGTTTTGAPRFLMRVSAHERAEGRDVQWHGNKVFELRYEDGRVRLGPELYSSGQSEPGALVSAAPYGEDGGFVGAGVEALVLKAHRDAPLERWPRLWAPTTVLWTGLPGAEVVIALETGGGFWVGDPARGFEGLRFEPAPAGIGRCGSLFRVQHRGEPTVVAGCADSALLLRVEGEWRRVYPWLPELDSCPSETRRCGRPTFGPTNASSERHSGLDGTLWLSARGCPVSFSLALGEDRCVLSERWSLGALRVPAAAREVNELMSWQRGPDGVMGTGHGGLAVRMIETAIGALE